MQRSKMFFTCHLLYIEPHWSGVQQVCALIALFPCLFRPLFSLGMSNVHVAHYHIALHGTLWTGLYIFVSMCTTYTTSRWWCSFRCIGQYSAIINRAYIHQIFQIKMMWWSRISMTFLYTNVQSTGPWNKTFTDRMTHLFYCYSSGLYTVRVYV